jgi:hypothetical protein
MKMLEVTCDTLEIFFKKYYDRTHEIIEHLANKGHEKEQSEPESTNPEAVSFFFSEDFFFLVETLTNYVNVAIKNE